jgi:pimeloyl-ACP methyl ester carboxylesterase
MHADGHDRRVWPFLAGLLGGAAGTVLAQALMPRRSLDTRLLRSRPEDPDIPPTVIVPGILGSQLRRPDGTQAWLNLGNAVGAHDLTLPLAASLQASRDDLLPGGLLGVDEVLPRLFGFTEYADLLDLLAEAGFRRDQRPRGSGPLCHVFTYDWRRDLVESARCLGETLDALANAIGDPGTRFNLVGHSMGGLVARYYLRFGGAEPAPGAPVAWAGARRVRNLVTVATPNGGSIPALDSILNGSRVGLSSATLAPRVVARCPSMYELLPPAGVSALIDEGCQPLETDLQDPATWERHAWGPWAPDANGAQEEERAFAVVALARARAFHDALARAPDTACPVRVVALGGDCLPTLARALVPEGRTGTPRFDPWTRAEARAMFEAGDGRVTRASLLATHLPGAEDSETGSGLPEVVHAFLGDADHHGIYAEPTFQSVLLRLLMRPARRRLPVED